MTEAILTVGVFAVPILAVAIIEQRKRELKRRKRELALMREMEQINQFKYEIKYRTERQQVDKEEKQYARTVD